MAQDLSAALVTKFQPILDEVYKAASVTAFLDGKTKPINFAGANVVEVLKATTAPLANYGRESGYVKGDLTLVWETMTLTQDRAREFSIDRMDDEETLGMAFGLLAGEFIRLHVAPEVDAYRFAKYAATGANELAAATYTASTILAAIDTAKAMLNADSVPADGRVLFLSDSVAGFLESSLTRFWGNDGNINRGIQTFDNMKIVVVPQSRFYQTVAITAGTGSTTAGGFVGTYPLNFMMVHPSAVLQVAKLEKLKVFDPDVNQDKDAWKMQYRIYHDAFVYSNKVDGIAYSHQVAA